MMKETIQNITKVVNCSEDWPNVLGKQIKTRKIGIKNKKVVIQKSLDIPAK